MDIRSFSRKIGFRGERGQSAVEYLIIFVVIALVIISTGAIDTIKNSFSTYVTKANNAILGN